VERQAVPLPLVVAMAMAHAVMVMSHVVQAQRLPPSSVRQQPAPPP